MKRTISPFGKVQARNSNVEDPEQCSSRDGLWRERKRAPRGSLEEPVASFECPGVPIIRPESRGLRRERASGYGLVFFLGAGAGFFAVPAVPAFPVFRVSPPARLSKVRESLALKGKRRTDCSPVVLRVTSTRRLLARRTVSRFFRIFCFSAALRSGSASIRFLTSSEVMFFSKPNALVSMWSAGTPFSTR